MLPVGEVTLAFWTEIPKKNKTIIKYNVIILTLSIFCTGLWMLRNKFLADQFVVFFWKTLLKMKE
jgi:hypothetical protein